MGRFFQTTPTQFTEDFIYQPPRELIQQAAAKTIVRGHCAARLKTKGAAGALFV